MSEGRILVVTFSESFDSLWQDLAEHLGVEVGRVESSEVLTNVDSAAIVFAAGGAEREALEWLVAHGTPAHCTVFVVGSNTSRRMATQVVAAGARDYFALPEDVEVFQNTVQSASERWMREHRRTGSRRRERKSDAFKSITGESVALNEVLSRSARVLPHDETTVFIVGETGTGKELLARALHYGGPRGRAPFVAVNCSALPDRLIESELFGHERGAFTDAVASKPGLFELAEGGTLFLDEIGEMPLDLQPKLLRVLQDKQIRRVGGTKWRRVNVRIVAATNADLAGRLKTGEFRQDLYFRLSVITLHLPPLRERGDDVLLIAEALFTELAGQYRLPVPQMTAEVRQALVSYNWPGNVRELRNAIERTLLLSPKGELDLDELRPKGTRAGGDVQKIPFPATLDDIVTAAAIASLEVSGGNRSVAARSFGISRQRLRRMLGVNGGAAASAV